jgi:UDP-N-acetylglucosamine 4-epimerase
LGVISTFWSKADPNGAYVAVIPKFVMQLMNERITINGDGNYSRGLYPLIMIQMNALPWD